MRTQRITVDLGPYPALTPGALLTPIAHDVPGWYIVVDVLPEGDGISAGDDDA
jgi:hypothetical protein